MSRATKRRKLSSSKDSKHTKNTKTKAATVTDKIEISDTVDQPSETQPQLLGLDIRYDEELPSIKGLASSDSTVRRKAFTTIIDHLNSRDAHSVVSSTQWLQLWRGFHVCVYMHDSKNMVSVQNLIKDIARIFGSLAAKDAVLREKGHVESVRWVSDCHVAFWETIVREWPNIDSHRMNKYLLLIRFVVREVFKTVVRGLSDVSQNELDSRKEQLRRDVMAPMLDKGPLKPTARMGSGLILHLLDIWNTELEVAINEGDDGREQNPQGENEKEETGSSTSKNRRELLALFKTPLDDIARSDSGAPKPVRLRAKETIAEFEDKFLLDKE